MVSRGNYRKNGYWKAPDGSEVVGLKRRPDGRFYAARQPTKTFGKDPAEALFRYRQWLARQGREVVTVSVSPPVSINDADQLGRWLLSEESDRNLCIDLNSGTVSQEIDEAAFYARARAEILKDPKLFAKKVGVPEIGYMEKLEVPPPPLSLIQAGEIYHSEREPEINPKQLSNSKTWWAEFVTMVPVEFVDQLDRDVFQAYATQIKVLQKRKSDKTGKPRSSSFTRSRFVTVTTILNYLKDAQKISNDLHQRLRSEWKQPLTKPKKRKGKKYVITPEEFEAMLGKADDFMTALLMLGVNAAFYPSDFAIPWEAIDLDAQTLCYRREKCDSGDYEGVLRTAVLWPETCEALAKLKKDKTPHIFTTRTGNPIAASTVWGRFKRLRERAGVKRPLRPEDLRNTAATLAARNAPKAQYDVLMGHSLGAEDEGYIERQPDFTRDACQAIREYLFPRSKQSDENPPLWRVCRPNIAIKKAVRLMPWIPESEGLHSPGQLAFCSAAPRRWPVDPWYRWWMEQDAGTVHALLQCQVRAWSLHLAQLCHSGGLNLLQENPALALAIAMQDPQAFPDLLRSNRECLLGRLGFPSRPAQLIMNVLQRVEARDLSPKFLVRLRALLKKPAVLRKLYRSGARIDRVCLSLLRPAVVDYVTPDLLAEVSNHGALHAQEFEDLLATAIELGKRINRPLQSLHDLESLLDELRESVEDSVIDSFPLPAAPLPGMIVQQHGIRFVIAPITTVKGVRLEGIQQRNCSESLLPEIRSGYMYLYRAVFEEHDGRRVRLTVAIERSSQEWIISDIRARANRQPDDDVIQSCRAWKRDCLSLERYLS